MRWLRAILVMALLSASARICWAEEEPAPEQLRRMYDAALVQLKELQARRNELAGQNEKLLAKVTELQNQVTELQGRVDSLRKEADQTAEKTFALRWRHAAWQDFLRLYPAIRARWEVFLENSFSLSAGDEKSAIMDPDWPLSGSR